MEQWGNWTHRARHKRSGKRGNRLYIVAGRDRLRLRLGDRKYKTRAVKAQRGISGMTPIDFSNLEKYSKTISDGSDKVNQALAEIQEKLNSLNLGVEAWLDSGSLRETLSLGESRAEKERTLREVGTAKILNVLWLGYGKDEEGNWGLLVSEVTERRAEGGSHNVLLGQNSRLLDASRDLRIRALDLIPLLIEKLEGKAEELVETVSKATTSADKL